MIRINLLVKKVSKKKAGVIQHLAIGAGVLVLAAGVCAWLWVGLTGDLALLTQKIKAAEAEKARLKDVNEEKTKYEKEQGELERKLGIITSLQKERSVPVHLLDELTKVIDVGTPVWLDKLTIALPLVTISGFSLSNEALRPLVEGLERSPYYQGVDLKWSEKREIEKREVFNFEITATVQDPATEPAPAAAPAAGAGPAAAASPAERCRAEAEKEGFARGSLAFSSYVKNCEEAAGRKAD